jgi:ABC-type thiamine transport system substrate-binding protein
LGGQLSTGSRHECLWGAWDQKDQFYIGGCSYSKDWGNRFSYSWSPGASLLTLSYITDPHSTDQFTATVQVNAAEGDYFDMLLDISGAGLAHAHQRPPAAGPSQRRTA